MTLSPPINTIVLTGPLKVTQPPRPLTTQPAHLQDERQLLWQPLLLSSLGLIQKSFGSVVVTNVFANRTQLLRDGPSARNWIIAVHEEHDVGGAPAC